MQGSLQRHSILNVALLSVIMLSVGATQRHLSNIDCLMACTACFVCFISTVNGCSKKVENAMEDVALVAGTRQNLSNLLFFRYLWGDS
jgi:hypothetical protein